MCLLVFLCMYNMISLYFLYVSLSVYMRERGGRGKRERDECRCPWAPEEGHWIPGAGVIGDYEFAGDWVLKMNVCGGKGEWPHEPRIWNDVGISVRWVCTQLGLYSSLGKDISAMAVLPQASGGLCSQTLDSLIPLCWERNTGTSFKQLKSG